MKLSVRSFACVFIVLLVVEQAAIFASAAAAHRVEQKGRAFAIPQLEIAHGDSVIFSNDDPFLHQIYVKSPGLNFESDEQFPGETVEVKFPTTGTYDVRCHIHPKMLLTVHVS